MKNKKYKVCLYIILLIAGFIISQYKIKAHETLLNVGYDVCSKENGIDGINEIWYYLSDFYYSKGSTITYDHFDDSVYTIKYYISNCGKDDASYEWDTDVSTSVANQIKNGFVQSMLKWNNVYFYKYDNLGNVTSCRLINIVEGTASDNNIIIYPFYIDGDAGGSEAKITYARTGYDKLSASSTSSVGNMHYLHWYMEVNVKDIASEFDYTTVNFSETIIGKRTGQHEMGHVLGLDDVDECCKISSTDLEHHEEILMGYGDVSKRVTYATYKDIAGVTVTRGLHTDNDHLWMKRVNDDSSMDMICPICNGVRKNVSLDNGNLTYQGKPFTIYKDCIHYGGTNSNNLKVASDGEREFFKCLNCRHIDTIEINSVLQVSNYSSPLELNLTINNYKSIYYKLNSNYLKSYEMNVYGRGQLDVKLFDKNFNEIEIIDFRADSSYFRSVCNLDVSTYYIKIENKSNLINVIDVDIYSRKTVYLSKNVEYDILINSCNNVKDYYFVNGDGPGFYEIKVDGLKTRGSWINSENTISIYNSSNKNSSSLIKKINSNEFIDYATNRQRESSFFFCLEGNGVYYLDININGEDLKELKVLITPVSSENFSLFSLEENMDDELCTFSPFYTGDYVKSIKLKESGKFDIDVCYSGDSSRNFIFFISSKMFDEENNSYEITTLLGTNLNSSNNVFHTTLNLKKGTYYFGYLGKSDGEYVDVTLTRSISQYGSYAFLVDPGSEWLCGSQINIVEMYNTNKSYNSNQITNGFTRVVYLNSILGISDSRLDYEWYSSNNSIIDVTRYGTVLGCGIGTAKIMAVLKSDLSKAFVKNFTVVEDDDTGLIVVESNYYVDFEETENGLFHLELEKLNCPYPMYQYYNWSITNNAGINVYNDFWGNYFVDRSGSFTIVGNDYIYNSRHITIILLINVFVI